MGWMTGFEPATSGSTIRRSNQLSYTHHQTCDLHEVRILSEAHRGRKPGLIAIHDLLFPGLDKQSVKAYRLEDQHNILTRSIDRI